MVRSAVWILAATVVASAQAYEPAPHRRRALDQITGDYIRGVVRFLADDMLEGRAPGTRGDRLAQLYIATEFQKLGLKPAFGPAGWIQRVPLVGMTTECPAVLVFEGQEGVVRARHRKDYVAVAGRPVHRIQLRRAEVVFAGYGIVAPEYDWNDYEGVDVRGKVVLLLNNDPSHDPRLFEGPARTYYGRWDYKYSQAAKQGAVGAIVIHTTESAGYPWGVVESSWTGEQFQLRGDPQPRPLMEGWITRAIAEELVSLAGKNLEQLEQAAQQRTFRAVPLGVHLSVDLSVTLRSVETANVVALLPGRSRPQEAVVYTAHFDHIGMDPAAGPGEDAIYNGALDNASGVAAMLAVARAFAAQKPQPERTICFAAVGAEEQGLLGSKHLAQNPPPSLQKIIACLNLDGMNIWGPTRDVTVIGLGRTTLDRWIRQVATWQGRRVKPDQFPDRGFYFRSDHFSFARVGVPAVSLEVGTEFIGRSEDWGKRVIEEWEREHYHRPSDEYRDTWDLRGAVQDVVLWYLVGSEVADDPELPDWSHPHARPRTP